MSNKKRPKSAMEEAGPALVPKLRFPEFRNSDDWRPETMSGVATVVMGSSPKSECYNESQNGLPLLQGNADIKNRLSAPRIFTSEITKECQVGDILMSVRAPVGSIAKSIHHACIGRGIAAIHAKQPNCQEFLYQWLLSYEPRWVNISQGGTFDAINSDDLKHVGLTTPKPAEQQKIAECLSSLDELMAAQARKVDALKTHKKGLMQQLFPREGETQPRLRFPEFRDAGEWEVNRLDELVDIQSGATPSKANPTFWNGSVPWVSAKDMKRLYLEDAEDHISAEAIDHGARLVPPGTLLILTRGMTLLKDVPICVLSREMSFNQDVKGLRTKDGFDELFLAWILIGNKHRLLAMVNVAGHGTGKLDTDELKALELAVPSITEQKRIASCLSSLDALITAETNKLEALKTHKKGLMQQLFPSPENIEA